MCLLKSANTDLLSESALWNAEKKKRATSCA